MLKRAVLVLIAVALWASPAAAEQESLRLSSASVAQGEQITAWSSGWAPGALVKFATSGGSIPLAAAVADDSGAAAATFVVPKEVGTGNVIVGAMGAGPGINVQRFTGAALRVTHEPGMSLDRGTVSTAGAVVASSAGWKPGAKVTFSFAGARSTTAAVADTDGQASASVDVPAGITPGRRFVVATGEAQEPSREAGATAGVTKATASITRGVQVAPDRQGDMILGLMLTAALGLGAVIKRRLRRPR